MSAVPATKRKPTKKLQKGEEPEPPEELEHALFVWKATGKLGKEPIPKLIKVSTNKFPISGALIGGQAMEICMKKKAYEIEIIDTGTLKEVENAEKAYIAKKIKEEEGDDESQESSTSDTKDELKELQQQLDEEEDLISGKKTRTYSGSSSDEESIADESSLAVLQHNFKLLEDKFQKNHEELMDEMRTQRELLTGICSHNTETSKLLSDIKRCVSTDGNKHRHGVPLKRTSEKTTRDVSMCSATSTPSSSKKAKATSSSFITLDDTLQQEDNEDDIDFVASPEANVKVELKADIDTSEAAENLVDDNDIQDSWLKKGGNQSHIPHKFALAIMNDIFTMEEMKTCLYPPVNSARTSHQPFPPDKVALMKATILKKFKGKEETIKWETIKASIDQACRDSTRPKKIQESSTSK